MIIHKEGRKILFVLLLILVGINLFITSQYPQSTTLQNFVLFGSIIVYLLILQFFRNPRVATAINEKQIIAPADGKVVVIEEALETEYFNSQRKQVSIFMSPLNVHVNRNPISGIIKYFKYHPGQYLVAWHPKASSDNERTTLVIQQPDGVEVLFRQIAGALARRIKWYVKEGDSVQQGQEFGFIKFGSRIDLYLPLDAVIKVKIGQKTKAGVTVVAELP
jgi:phosphatidylserine decarboxylase